MKKWKISKKVKKGIDKVEKKWYTNKAVGKNNKLSRKVEKNSKKSLRKPLDKAATKWYNKQAVDRKVTANRSLKIEQQ